MSDEYSFTLKIPLDRVGALIGKDGQTKEELEELTGTQIKVNSQEGEVKIKSRDSVKLFNTREIVKAIGRGFNPDIAKILIKTDFILDILDIQDYAGRKKKHLKRIKGRLIGSQGKSRKTLEDLSDCHISVYGKTVAIIGKAENIANLRAALQKLIRGAPHAHAYKFLEDKRREKKLRFLENEEFPHL